MTAQLQRFMYALALMPVLVLGNFLLWGWLVNWPVGLWWAFATLMVLTIRNVCWLHRYIQSSCARKLLRIVA